MKLSLNWLREFTEISISTQAHLHDVVVGYVESVIKHPNADKLNVAQIEIMGGIHQIVCGANNLKVGQKVPVALSGVTLPGNFQIGQRDIRGVESNGMICAENEIGLTETEQEGIMILDQKWETGTPMSTVLKVTGYSPKHLSDLITLHTAEVEGFELINNDLVFDIDNKSLTHRPDLWSHYGFARELATITDSALKAFKTTANIPAKGESVKVEILDHELCPRFSVCIVTNVQIEDSPKWLQEKLKSVGIASINNVVDITNYVMAELGQPMHAYDRKYVKNDHIIIRNSSGDESLTTLDGKTHKLQSNDPLVCDSEKPLGLAGIMGGASSQITPQTTEIIFEAANWHPSRVRRSATSLGLRTDASQRFEKSLDPELCETALIRALELLISICPQAKIAGPLTDLQTKKTKTTEITLSYDRVQQYIGCKIETKAIKDILSKLGFILGKETNSTILVTVPSWRATKDISIEADLIEEIARIHGYENIEPLLPNLPTTPPETNISRTAETKLRRILQGLGATEVYNYSFYSEKDLQNALLNPDEHLLLKNYLSENQTHLRASLTPNLLHSISTNLKNFSEFTIFEIGRTYTKTNDFYPAEEIKLSICCVTKNAKQKEFFRLKGLVEETLSNFLDDWEIIASESAKSYAHPKQSADILTSGQYLGALYNLHPLVKTNFDLTKANIAIAEINLGPLLHHQKEVTNFEELPLYPGLEFDVSVVVPESITANNLIEQIKLASPDLIKNINLFDIYRGANIGNDKKALAFKITLRHSDRTLNDSEMADVQNKIFINLQKLGGEIRGL